MLSIFRDRLQKHITMLEFPFSISHAISNDNAFVTSGLLQVLYEMLIRKNEWKISVAYKKNWYFGCDEWMLLMLFCVGFFLQCLERRASVSAKAVWTAMIFSTILHGIVLFYFHCPNSRRCCELVCLMILRPSTESTSLSKNTLSVRF